MNAYCKIRSLEALAKTALVCSLLGSAVQQGHAQGEINYTIRISTRVVGHVYGPEFPDPTIAKVGNTALEIPADTQTYTGILLEGSGWSAQLFAARGSSQPESSLFPVATSVTTFLTSAISRGTIAPSIQTIPGIANGETGTFQLRAWNNQGGTITSWFAAEPLWLDGSIAAGKS